MACSLCLQNPVFTIDINHGAVARPSVNFVTSALEVNKYLQFIKCDDTRIYDCSGAIEFTF